MSEAFDGGLALAGAEAITPSISPDGQYMAYISDALNYAPVAAGTVSTSNVLVKNLKSGNVTLASVGFDGFQANGHCYTTSISRSGRFVAFGSNATNLAPGDTNGRSDVFVRDLVVGTTVRVSVASDGSQANADSGTSFSGLSISDDGRFVAFGSGATNLVPGDTNEQFDVFVRDLAARTTVRASIASDGSQANVDSGTSFSGLSISDDGRFVAFGSGATNLVPGDTNGPDVFVRDLAAGTTVRASIASDGSQANNDGLSGVVGVSISGDGRFVAFGSGATNLAPGDTNGQLDVFVRDLAAGTTVRASIASDGSQANSNSGYGRGIAVSGNGQLVAFVSLAANLVTGDTNGIPDVFVRDLAAGTTVRASIASDGSEANSDSGNLFGVSISDDGQFVAFASDATNLVSGDTNGRSDVFVRDLAAETTARSSLRSDGAEDFGPARFLRPSLSTDGRFVAFTSDATNLVPGDTNEQFDVFVRDLAAGTTMRASVANGGSQANSDSGFFDTVTSSSVAISGNGRFVAFASEATNLVPDDTNGRSDVFVRDLAAGTTMRVSIATDGSQANSDSGYNSGVAISGNGRLVAFASDATNLVLGDTNGRSDAFVHDLTAGTTVRASVASDGSQASIVSGLYTTVAISGNGRLVAFASEATNLAPGDTNGQLDVFVRDLVVGTTVRAGVASDGSQANGGCYYSSLSGDGRLVAFASDATNLAPGDTNGQLDVFVRDLVVGTTVRASVASDGSQANDGSYSPSLSGDGRFVAFGSNATNLAPGDTNQHGDVFVSDLAAGTTIRVSIASDGSQADLDSSAASISGDGRFAAFVSEATNLVPGDTNGGSDVFISDLSACAMAAPAGLTAAPLSANSIRLDWYDPNLVENGTKVERRSGTTGPFILLGVVEPTAGTGAVSFTDTDLGPSALYTYRIRAFNAGGDSAYSNQASATTLSLPPTAPSGFTAAAVSAVRIDLAWTDNSTNEDGFKIERKTGSSGFLPVATTIAGVAAYSDTGLSPGIAYTYRIRAFNAGGDSAYSNEVSANTLVGVATFTLSTYSTRGGSVVRGTVTISDRAPAGGAVVTLGSSNRGAARISDSIKIRKGTTTARLTVSTRRVIQDTPVTLTARYGGASRSAELTVRKR